MEVFLLIVTSLLLIGRIKSTPHMLSSKLYHKKIQTMFETIKDTLDKYNELKKMLVIHDKNNDILYGIYVLIFLLIEIFMCGYYVIVANRFSTSAFMVILSVLQIITCFINSKNIYRNPYTSNIDNYKFHRWVSLFNVVLDYIYYPITIYMLFK